MVQIRAGLQKTSLVNYPGRVAAAVFLPGCNLRCPYCYNRELAEAGANSGPDGNTEQEYFSVEEILSHLEKRANVLTGLAISGGEPLLSPALEPLIKKARALGLAVKLDTNGLLPDRLAALIADGEIRPDMVALDIKTSPAKYSLLRPPVSAVSGAAADTGANTAQTAQVRESAGERLLRTAGILKDAAEKKLLEVEYRTVLVPSLVTEQDIREIARLLPPDAAWKFAAFVPGSCLDPAWNSIKPYTQAETEELVKIAREHVTAAELR